MGGGGKKKNKAAGLASGAGGGVIAPAVAPEPPAESSPPTPLWGSYWQWQANAFKKYQAGEIGAVDYCKQANEMAKFFNIPVPLGIEQMAGLSSEQDKLKKELAPFVEAGEIQKPLDFDYIGVAPVDSLFWKAYDDEYTKFITGETTYEQFNANLKRRAMEYGYGESGGISGAAQPPAEASSSEEQASPAGSSPDEGEQLPGLEPEQVEEPAGSAEAAPPPAWLLEASPVRDGFWSEVAEAGPLGRPLMVAGPDVEDQTLTATMFGAPGGDPGKDRLVLFGKVREESEAKLLDALDLEGGHVVKVKKQVEQVKPFPLDKEEGFYEQLLKVAKSVNYHVGEGKDNVIPEHTVKGIQELTVKLAAASFKEKQAGGDAGVLAMIQHYQEQLKAVESAANTKTKAPKVTQFTAPQMVEVEEEVIVPNAPGEGLAAKKRTGSRIAADDVGGRAVWDGQRDTNQFYGVEYAIDLGDGYQAVYHPNDSSVPFSLRGTLEVISPPGVKDGREALQKLKSLHLHAEPPASAQEAEVMYLERNVWAQDYGNDSEYRAINQELENLAMKQEAKLVSQLEAVSGLSQEEQLALAKELVLQNERSLLAEKARLLKRFFEKKMGLAPGGLEKLPSYRPVPGAAQQKKGFYFWNRFDLTPEQVKQKAKGYVLTHKLEGVGSDSKTSSKADVLCRIIENGGVLASTELRRRMGVKHSGMSSTDDMKTGGASYAFTFFRKASQQKSYDIVWDPETLLTRSDWFATKYDAYGVTNPKDYKYNTSGRTRKVEDLPEYAKETKAGSLRAQVMFKNGIDLLGEHAPKYIFVETEADRQKMLASFAKIGVRELKGRPVEEVVQVR